MDGKKIAFYRKLNGLTQQELANSVDVSRSMISLLELDRTTTNDSTMLKIAKTLHVKADDLKEDIADARKNLLETIVQLTLSNEISWVKATKNDLIGFHADREQVAYFSDSVLDTVYLLFLGAFGSSKDATLHFVDEELIKTVEICKYEDYPVQFDAIIKIISNLDTYSEYGKIAKLFIEAKSLLDKE